MDPWVVEVLHWGYCSPFRVVPTLSKEPIPYPFYGPSSIRGKALDAEVLSLVEKGAVELAPLPSPGFYSQLFVVMKASGSWRPVIDLSSLNESEGSQDIFQDEDSPVSSSPSPEGRLDGVSGLEVCVLASYDSSGQLQVPQVRGFRSDLPIQSVVLWSLHGTSGLYQGHGSGFRHASSCGNSHPQLSRRLADSGCVLSSGTSGSEHRSSFMSSFGNRRQLGEVSPRACAKGDLSGRTSGLGEFQGFACPEARREASLNRRRISILCGAASVFLARAFRGSGFSDNAGSGRSPQNAVSSTHSSSTLGSP